MMTETSAFPKKQRPRIKVTTLNEMKKRNEQVAALSIYSCDFSLLADQAGLDMIIIGDSLGMTVLGHENTLPVTMDQMITFASAACRRAGSMFTVGDLPLGSYQESSAEAVRNATRFIKEAGCAAVKCEASMKLMSRFEAIANAEVLVMGHIGLNPQKIHEMGGYRIQGKTIDGTLELLKTAKALQDAGAFAILLEGVTEEVSGIVHAELEIPVYGIGSGRYLDGQLLIGHDVFGLSPWESPWLPLKRPKYIREYRSPATGNMTVGEHVLAAISNYVKEVKSREFPGEENVHRVTMKDFEDVTGDRKEEAQRILRLISKLSK